MTDIDLKDEMQINYITKGSGKDVLILHGWGAEIHMFDSLIDHLANSGCRVTAVDLPGFGGTDAPVDPWDVYQYADFVSEFMLRQKIDLPVIVGHSFGGRLAVILGSRGLAKKLVLTDAAGIVPKRGIMYYLKVYSFKLAKRMLKLPGLNKFSDQIMELWSSNVGSSDYSASHGVMRQILVKVVNEDLRHLMPKIDVPALLIWGDKDLDTPLADAQLMEKLIPDAGLVVFEGAGHYAFLEEAVRFNIIVDYFVHNEE